MLALVFEVFFDERGVTCARVTFLKKDTFVFFDVKKLYMSNR